MSWISNVYACSRQYYERTNELIEQYMYIDQLLDSSIPHELLNEYSSELEASAYRPVDVPATIPEDEPQAQPQSQPQASMSSPSTTTKSGSGSLSYGTTTPTTPLSNGAVGSVPLQKRTPKDIFPSSETLPLLQRADSHDSEDDRSPTAVSDSSGPRPKLPWLEDAEIDSDSPIVTLAIWVNFIANAVLLAGKLIVIISVPSMSVLASLVDAVLDFLSTAIVWTTTHLISSSQKDQHSYPVGRRRLEPVGVLVFSIIMITSFCQVALQCIERLAGSEHELLQLGIPAIGIMLGTVIIKGAAFFWCRLVNNSSVRAL